MIFTKENIKDFPFFHSHIPNSDSMAVIDVGKFNDWMNQLTSIDLLSGDDIIDREQAFNELAHGKALSLKDAMREW